MGLLQLPAGPDLPAHDWPTSTTGAPNTIRRDLEGSHRAFLGPPPDLETPPERQVRIVPLWADSGEAAIGPLWARRPGRCSRRRSCSRVEKRRTLWRMSSWVDLITWTAGLIECCWQNDSGDHYRSPRKTMRSIDNHSDESETSSVCSERSFDSYRRPSDVSISNCRCLVIVVVELYLFSHYDFCSVLFGACLNDVIFCQSYSWSGSQQRLSSRELWEPCRVSNYRSDCLNFISNDIALRLTCE